MVNHKRLFRIYREEGLMVRKRKGRKRAVGQRFPIPFPSIPTICGRGISFPTSSSPAADSASGPSTMSARGAAWGQSRTSRYRANVWCARSIGSDVAPELFAMNRSITINDSSHAEKPKKDRAYQQ